MGGVRGTDMSVSLGPTRKNRLCFPFLEIVAGLGPWLAAEDALAGGTGHGHDSSLTVNGGSGTALEAYANTTVTSVDIAPLSFLQTYIYKNGVSYLGMCGSNSCYRASAQLSLSTGCNIGIACVVPASHRRTLTVAIDITPTVPRAEVGHRCARTSWSG